MPSLRDFFIPPINQNSYALPWGIPEVQIANNASDPTNGIDFSGGVVVVGNGSQRIAVEFPPMTKNLGSNWAAGAGGGLAAGSKSNSTWYYLFGIFNPISKVRDYLFSVFPDTPTLPAGFSYLRRIGAIQTQANGAIRPFAQAGDIWQWVDRIVDMNSVAVPTTETTYTFTVPPGFPVEVLGHLTAGLGADGGGVGITLRSFNAGYITPSSGTSTPAGSGWRGSAAGYLATGGAIDVRLATANSEGWVTQNGQLKAQRQGTYGTGQTSFQTIGWRDISVSRGI